MRKKTITEKVSLRTMRFILSLNIHIVLVFISATSCIFTEECFDLEGMLRVIRHNV